MEEFILVDGQHIPIRALEEDDQESSFCAECYDHINPLYSVGKTKGGDVWCYKCISKIKCCIKCDSPKYFSLWPTEWGDYTCGKCSNKSSEAKMVIVRNM